MSKWAFNGCSSLTAVDLPEGLQSIGDYAFQKCTSLTSITLPEGLTSIGEQAFCDCTSLTAVDLPEGLQSIGEHGFEGCTSLTSITLPESLGVIGEKAFSGCASLKSVEILSNGTSNNNRCIYLGGEGYEIYDDEYDLFSTGGDEVFPRHQGTLIYAPNTTWIGDDDTQNLRYYFNKFETPK